MAKSDEMKSSSTSLAELYSSKRERKNEKKKTMKNLYVYIILL